MLEVTLELGFSACESCLWPESWPSKILHKPMIFRVCGTECCCGGLYYITMTLLGDRTRDLLPMMLVLTWGQNLWQRKPLPSSHLFVLTLGTELIDFLSFSDHKTPPYICCDSRRFAVRYILPRENAKVSTTVGTWTSHWGHDPQPFPFWYRMAQGDVAFFTLVCPGLGDRTHVIPHCVFSLEEDWLWSKNP